MGANNGRRSGGGCLYGVVVVKRVFPCVLQRVHIVVAAHGQRDVDAVRNTCVQAGRRCVKRTRCVGCVLGGFSWRWGEWGLDREQGPTFVRLYELSCSFLLLQDGAA